MQTMAMATTTALKHLSSASNGVLNRCAQKLDTSVDSLVEDFGATWKPEFGDYSRKLVEYCCSKTLRQKPLEPGESVSDSSFSRFTFDMMLAWQMPSSANEASYEECLGKEREEKKLPLKVTPAHEDVSLFYSDIMPLLVDHGQGVEEDAFVWFSSIFPLAGDVPTGRFSFETLTTATANLLHYPAYDKYLKEINKCIKHLQKQETPNGAEFADDEFILHVEGTASSARVIRHIGGESWPGRLTLTNYALYFEASTALNYEKALKISLSKNTEQSVKSAATGPWGAPLFDKAMIYKSLEMKEGVVLEFPEVTSSTRRDHWLALTKEIIFLHQFLWKHESHSSLQVWEMHARTILGIVRLHAAREMLRMAPPLPRSFLIFTLFDELPKGDYVLEELAGTLELIDSGDLCSASSILRYLNMPHELEAKPDSDQKEPDMAEKAASVNMVEKAASVNMADKAASVSTQDGSISTLDDAVTEVREQAKEIQVAKATTDGLKEEGVGDSAHVLLELLKPLRGGWTWAREVLAWKRPISTVNVIAAILLIAYLEWIGKALAIGLLWLVYEMVQARTQNTKDRYDRIVVCTASDKTAVESIVSAQQGLRTAHDLVQQINIAILKIYSILMSRAPKQTNTVMIWMCGIAVILMVVPFKYIVMGATLCIFATTSKSRKNVMAKPGNRRIKEWWDSIPVVPVEFADDNQQTESESQPK